MTLRVETVPVDAIAAKVAEINALGGTLVQVLHHQAETDGVGPLLIVFWNG